MSEEKYKKWLKNRSNNVSGSKNSQYGVSPKDRMDEETYKMWIDNHKNIIGELNPNSKELTVISEYGEIMKFNTIKDYIIYLHKNNITKLKESTIRSKILKSIKDDSPFLNCKYKTYRK